MKSRLKRKFRTFRRHSRRRHSRRRQSKRYRGGATTVTRITSTSIDNPSNGANIANAVSKVQSSALNNLVNSGCSKS